MSRIHVESLASFVGAGAWLLLCVASALLIPFSVAMFRVERKQPTRADYVGFGVLLFVFAFMALWAASEFVVKISGA